jgi:hypothetical protein
MMQAKISVPLIEQIKSVLKENPKRSGLLTGLGLVMLILCGRMLMTGPASATASFVRGPRAAITDSPLTTRSRANSAVLEWLARPKEPVSRDLFTIHMDDYTTAGDHPADSQFDPDRTPFDPDARWIDIH